MGSFIIDGGHRLSGEIKVQGAKNEALEVISAVLLTDKTVRISNIPEILDTLNLIKLLENMGVEVRKNAKGDYSFTAADINLDYVFSSEFVATCAKLRGSVMIAGPLLARFGRAYFPKPGGDKIGRRRVDTHIDGFLKLGAVYEYDTTFHAYHLTALSGLRGEYMLLDEASVTGTANILMAFGNSQG